MKQKLELILVVQWRLIIAEVRKDRIIVNAGTRTRDGPKQTLIDEVKKDSIVVN